jgi:hypothetical protein
MMNRLSGGRIQQEREVPRLGMLEGNVFREDHYRLVSRTTVMLILMSSKQPDMIATKR